jgi:hypothetical protein
MIPTLISALILGAAQPAAPPKPPTASGLISTSQFTVRAVVVDSCTVSSTGATCQGVVPIRPMARNRALRGARTDIVF